jgi:hypothetical protein
MSKFEIARELAIYVEPMLNSDLHSRVPELAQRWQAIKRDHAKRGLAGPHTWAAVTKAATELLDQHAKHVCDEVIRVHQVLGLKHEPDTADALQMVIKERIDAAYNQFAQYPRQEEPAPNLTNENFIRSKEQFVQRSLGEARLYAAGLAAGTHPTSKGGAVTTTMNFNAPVGAVMTGEHARATVSQSFTSEHRELVLKALDAVSSAIESAPELMPRKTELHEVVVECRELTRHEKPNGVKLMGFLKGLSGVLSGIANADRAYQAIQHVITALSNVFP